MMLFRIGRIFTTLIFITHLGWLGLFASSLSSCQAQTEQSHNQLLIQTKQSGVYQIVQQDLIRNGLRFDSFDYAHLNLESDGESVPFWLEDDTLTFYAEGANGRYATHRTFWLKGNQAGSPLQPINTSIAPSPMLNIQYEVEANEIYESRAASQVTAPWFWMQVPHGQTVVLPFAYPHQPIGEQTLSLSLWGLTHHDEIEPDHTSDLFINGRFLSTLSWDGQNAYQVTISLPEGWLQSGNNELRFDNAQNRDAPVDVFYVDRLQIEGYASPNLTVPFVTSHADDIDFALWSERPFIFPTNRSNHPFYVSPKTAVISPQISRPTAWTPPPSDVDFVVILGDSEWETAVTSLTQKRESEGLSTHIVTIQQITEKFGNGTPHPNDIRTFLGDLKAQQSRDKQLFVLLVGDSAIDLQSVPNPSQLIPSAIIPITFGGETVSDAQLGDINGDRKVDVVLGRWPVASSQQIRVLVKKTFEAETAAYISHNHLIVDPSEPTFTAVAQRLPAIQTEPNGAKQSLITTYIGHGSLTQWGINNLQNDVVNQGSSPILLQFTCLTGLFAHNTPSLSETLLLSTNGPTHIVAATSLTLSAHQEPFAKALLNEFAVAGNGRIGTAFLNAQQSLNLTQPGQQEIHDTFVLLGDPTSTIHNQVEASP